MEGEGQQLGWFCLYRQDLGVQLIPGKSENRELEQAAQEGNAFQHVPDPYK